MSTLTMSDNIINIINNVKGILKIRLYSLPQAPDSLTDPLVSSVVSHLGSLPTHFHAQ